MTTTSAPRSADQLLSDIVAVAATLVPFPACAEHERWNAGIVELITELGAQLTAAEAV